MRSLLPFVLAAGLLVAACGGGGDDDNTPTPDPNEPFMDTSAPQLDDTAYVAALCEEIGAYMTVLGSKGEEEIHAARDTFEADVRAMHPPEGADEFHRNFVDYLVGVRSDPTLVITMDPPLPTGELRGRLAEAEAEAECEYPLFTRSDATPAPSATPGG